MTILIIYIICGLISAKWIFVHDKMPFNTWRDLSIAFMIIIFGFFGLFVTTGLWLYEFLMNMNGTDILDKKLPWKK